MQESACIFGVNQRFYFILAHSSMIAHRLFTPTGELRTSLSSAFHRCSQLLQLNRVEKGKDLNFF